MFCYHKPKFKNHSFLYACIVAKIITSKKNPEIVKEELLNSLRESDPVKERGFNIQNIINQWEAINIIKRCEEIIKTIGYERMQRQMLKKFKTMEGLSRSTVYFYNWTLQNV